MIEILYGSRFWKQARTLPKAQQEKLALLIPLLQNNPFDSLLHTKRLDPPLDGTLAFRITRDWRVQFRFIDGTSIQLMNVKHRKDIYR